MYKLQDGVERHSYGLNVARLAHIPEAIIHKAQEKSQALEEEITSRQYEHYYKRLLALLSQSDENVDGFKSLRIDLAHLVD